MKIWAAGTSIVIRGIVHGRVWIAHFVTVVEDAPELLVTYLTPGAPCKVPYGLIERKWGGVPNGASRWEEQDGHRWTMADWEWKRRHALILMPPDTYYGIYLFWSEGSWEFEGWYVNFQLPFRNTGWTIDTLDLELDLIVRPDGTHYWKDEAEYREGVRRGSIPADAAARVEEAREEVLAQVSNGSPLFDGKWLDWRPDPGWDVPQLHQMWDRIVDLPD